jgi:ribosomal protein L13E
MTVVGRLLSRYLFGPEPDPPFQIRPRTAVGPEVTLANGYSLIELKRVGLTIERAREMGLPVDRTRWSAVGANIMQLRRLLAVAPR